MSIWILDSELSTCFTKQLIRTSTTPMGVEDGDIRIYQDSR